MGSSEKLCLQWNDFKENIASSFKDLRNEKEFTDVTLACEDGQQIDVNKTVLASSSPFFKELFKKHKHPHPLIYMRGIKSNNLATVIDFLYYGEVKVLEEDLNSFLALAEEFKLKGLSDISQSDKEPHQSGLRLQSYRVPLEKELGQNLIDHRKAPVFEKYAFGEDQYTEEGLHDEIVAVTNSGVIVDLQDLDEQIKSMITKTDKSAGPGKGYLATCNVCGKEGSYRHMPQHVEANHITGVSHSCDFCGKISRSRNALKTHKLTFHK